GAPLAEIAAMLGLRIAQALGAAHGHGIVHRDVKPENVMFDGHRVVLCDFGIARVVAADGVTATGAVLGSPAYMSPEQASGGEIDARSDQFSLGALLYQLATGALPFSGTTPLVTMAKIVKGDHAPPSAKNPRVPPYLERVIERLLQSDPAARFPTVDACAEALRDGLTADGFTDLDAELAAYLRDPAGYNATAEPRIVEAAQTQADRARARGETARALAAANRVLAWRPNDARALALTAGLSARPRRIALTVAATALALVATGALGWRKLHLTELPSPPQKSQPQTQTPTPTPTPTPALTQTLPAPDPPKKAPPIHHVKTASALPPPPTVPPSGATHAIAPAPPTPPPQPAADAPATLAVAIAPWCDLTIDGQSRGRSPATLTLPPGQHHLLCLNPVSGNRLTRDLELKPGEHRELREKLYAMVRIQPRLTRGDALALDGGPPSSSPPQVEPGRRRVTLYKAGAEVETRWIDVPPTGCALVDAPRLSCEKP
ncbi:MAG: protein kinase domain-containing protein, partial [Polyangia bacterium]